MSAAVSRAFALCSFALAVACSEAPPTPAAPTGGGGGSGAAANAGSSSGGMPAAGSSGAEAGGSAGSTPGGSGGTAGGEAGAGGGGGSAGGGSGVFAGNAVAAVTLTYDDGLDPHLATVQPALDAVGLRGTFLLSNFEGVDHDWALPNAASPLNARHMAWQAAVQKGHELASHTVNHPCDNAGKAANWLLSAYDQTRMAAELDDSVARLTRLGGTAPFTFGYPCASDKKGIGAGGEDYSPLVAARFLAARVSDTGIADPATVDLLKVPHMDTGGKTGDEIKAMVDQAIAAKGWLVLLFHGVGTETPNCPQGLGYQPETCTINYLTTSTEAHAALVDYLNAKKAEVWTATFKEVATAIQASR